MKIPTKVRVTTPKFKCTIEKKVQSSLFFAGDIAIAALKIVCSAIIITEDNIKDQKKMTEYRAEE